MNYGEKVVIREGDLDKNGMLNLYRILDPRRLNRPIVEVLHVRPDTKIRIFPTQSDAAPNDGGDKGE